MYLLRWITITSSPLVSNIYLNFYHTFGYITEVYGKSYGDAIYRCTISLDIKGIFKSQFFRNDASMTVSPDQFEMDALLLNG